MFGLPKPTHWNEWGPDLALLRIPREQVGSFTARKVFYHPLSPPAEMPDIPQLEAHLLLGAPKAFGTFTPIRADFAISGLYTDVDAPGYERGEFDYVDVPLETSMLGNFGGVSGGGLWRVRIFECPSTGKLDSTPTLEGVAFYQSRPDDSRIIVRCHGPASIRAALAQVCE